MNQELIKDFIYDAQIEKVWYVLTNTAQMQKWYFPQLTRFEPAVGFTFEFDQSGGEYQKEWVVTRVQEGQRLAHSWAYKGYKGKSEVIFDLFAEGHKTRLRVRHIGIETLPDHPHFKRERFEWGWDNLLGENLRKLLEKGSNN